MPDLPAAYARGHAQSAEAATWTSAATRRRLALCLSGVRTNAWLLADYPDLVEQAHGYADGLADLLVRRGAVGRVGVRADG